MAAIGVYEPRIVSWFERNARARSLCREAMQQPGSIAQGGLAGLVLAGGLSRRFGEDKSTHLIDGVEMRVRAGLMLREVTNEVLLSAGRDVCERERARAVSEAWPFSACVEDIVDCVGPLGGLHAATAHLEAGGSTATHLVVVPCDMPWLRSASLRRLVDAVAGKGCDAAVAECDGRITGVVGCYRVALTTELGAFLADQSNGRSVERFVRSLRSWTVVPLPSAESRNVNHPADIHAGLDRNL